MSNRYLTIFLTSLASYLAVCWTLGIQHCDASWNELVLFFVMTYLYLKKYGHPLPVALCIVAGMMTKFWLVVARITPSMMANVNVVDAMMK